MTDRSDDSTARNYHYALETQNRETVREQGTQINKALKRIRRLTSNPSIPVVELLKEARDDEITQQHVTLPAVAPPNLALKKAIEKIEEERKAAEEPKKKKWFGWDD